MRLVIAGASSGVGKTTLTAGIIAVLRRRGLRVQPFKAGPDYIDPSYHTRAAGVPSRNLDTWMLEAGVLRELFLRSSRDADIAVVEGVMGLYDGHSGVDDVGSTAHLAKLLDAPVLLVIDAAKLARSAGALALGYQHFDPGVRLAGVIVNNVASEGHARCVTEAIISATGLPVLGCLRREPAFELPERHLGLIPMAEYSAPSRGIHDDFFDRLASAVAASIDLDTLLAISNSCSPILSGRNSVFPPSMIEPRVRIGVARDEAFSFYYEDSLDLLTAWGAQLIPFSPLHDSSLPNGIAGLYIGGGFPEMYGRQLQENISLRQSLSQAASSGMPIYGECGGLMYLAKTLVDFEGAEREMVGLMPLTCRMQRRRLALGYVTVQARRPSFLLTKGEAVRGHEFHWSELLGGSRRYAAYTMTDRGAVHEGYARDNVLASYVHLHFAAYPPLAPRFVDACARWAYSDWRQKPGSAASRMRQATSGLRDVPLPRDVLPRSLGSGLDAELVTP